jgi:hypothetical protein
MLGDGVSAAMAGINLGARRAQESAGEAFMAQVAALTEQLLSEEAATLPAPEAYLNLCCWRGRGRTAQVRILWRETVTARRCCRVSQPGCGTTAAGPIGSSSAPHRQRATARRADRPRR